ncbi:MAG: SBBP repeat-containing protein [Candidatus Hodarchaeales archaeon]|jgi:hypothetical protein
MRKSKISQLSNLFLIICLIFISIAVLNQTNGYITKNEVAANPEKENIALYNSIKQPMMEFDSSPEVDFISLLGGFTTDNAYSMVLDDYQNIYIAGWTRSPDFPTTVNAYNRIKSPLLRELFVSKISANGSSLIFSTFICGTNDDFSDGSLPALALDNTGNVILTASTVSDDFETTAGAISSARIGARDVIIVKLSADGSELLYGTYFGGSDEEMVIGLEIDEEDNIFIAGQTESTDFITTPGAFNESHSGPSPEGLDLFVAKIYSNGSLAFSTLFGGTGSESYPFLALDSQGNVIVVGGTSSTDMYTTTDALYPSPIGGDGYGFGKYLEGKDDFVVKFSADGSEVLYSTYIGGNQNEYINALTLDSVDNIYIGGSTSSSNFPVTADAYRQTNGHTPSDWIGDMFITKIAADGSEILSSTLFDGLSGSRFCRDISLDEENNIYFTGSGVTHVLSANMSNLLYANTSIGGFDIELVEQENNVAMYLLGEAIPTGSLFTGSHIYWLSPVQTGQSVFVAKFNLPISIPTSNTTSNTDQSTSTTTTDTTTDDATGGFDFMIIEALILISGVYIIRRKRR